MTGPGWDDGPRLGRQAPINPPPYRPIALSRSRPIVLQHRAPPAGRLYLAGKGGRIMARIQKIIPFLWFDDQAEAAARFYTSIFKNSKLGRISRYGEAGQEAHHRPPGSVMVVEFELEGQRFAALNGGPVFKFTEAISFEISCDTQEEVDYYWDKLSTGGDPKAQQCGWLKYKYGLSWQVVPTVLGELMTDPDPARAGRVMQAMLQMKKLDIAELERAAA